jgi:hypothetical protein
MARMIWMMILCLTNVEENDNLPFFVDLSAGKFVDCKNAFNNMMTKGSFRKATIQDYANWCAVEMADKCAPNVTWTICSNGLIANKQHNSYL